MNIGEMVKKIQSLPESQRKFIFIFVMAVFALIALLFGVSSTTKTLSQARLYLPSENTQKGAENDFPKTFNTASQESPMDGDSGSVRAPAGVNTSAGFDPNETFNFNDK